MHIKDNHHGWGFTEMIIFSGIILFFLTVAIFFVFKMYSSLGKTPIVEDPILPSPVTNGNKTYSSYEEMSAAVLSAAISYAKNTYPDGIGTDQVKVNIESLRTLGLVHDINDIYDNHTCDGYVTLQSDEKGNWSGNTYLNCSHYITPGY